MPQIQNKSTLIGNAESRRDRQARKLALGALEAALEAADPIEVVKSAIAVEDSNLLVSQHKFNLSIFENIYVVGGGKASGKMAEALESRLGNRISEGLINVPYNSGPYSTKIISLQEASHPIPDKAGMEGAKRILELVGQAEKNDLVICLISGGGSSLMPLPRGEITLEDKRQVTNALLKSGATINEFNTVRKHISALKGGWLAKNAYPATIINLILSDVIGDPLDFIASGPTVPDSTTFGDAIEVLRRYNLWKTTPQSVKTLLVNGQKGLREETPKNEDKVFKKAYNAVVGNNRSATSAACSSFRSSGLQALLLTSFLEGEARHVGTMLAAITKEVVASGSPLPSPCGIVVGGETTVTVVGDGKGGRNQEIALSAALKISGMGGIAIASLSTDGFDGPTEAAGALADGQTLSRSLELEMVAKNFIDRNDSFSFFSELNDAIFTGFTGTNVNDVSVIVVM